jgi:uncharacterized protein YeaO (DUF488 family)
MPGNGLFIRYEVYQIAIESGRIGRHRLIPMPIKTKRWDDPREPDDGFRLLVCRYRPRGLPKGEETWDAWDADLGPSRALHAAAYGKSGAPLNWPAYRSRYLLEMRQQREKIAELARRSNNGETLTLLCSSACTRESRCHRSLLKELIEAEKG